MSWYKKASNKDEMEKWFETRTNKHIERVQKYCKKIAEYDEKRFGNLIEQGKKHDESKLKNPERDPYVYVTWGYKCKDDGVKWSPPEDMDEKMNKATEHHVKNNRHHPEFHSDKEVNLINRNDRDKPPKELIDATKMPDLDIAEMCADWLSMSEEKGSNPRDWAKKNINVRWKFNKKQEDLIYELIENIWEKQ